MFGSAGRRAVEQRLPTLRAELGAGFCVVNGENVADGRVITGKLADRLLAAGADVITLGNHVWARPGFDGYIAKTDDALAQRPLFWSATMNEPTEAPLDSGGSGSSHNLGLDYVPAGVSGDPLHPDNIIFDFAGGQSASGFGHVHCRKGHEADETAIAAALPPTR